MGHLILLNLMPDTSPPPVLLVPLCLCPPSHRSPLTLHVNSKLQMTWIFGTDHVLISDWVGGWGLRTPLFVHSAYHVLPTLFAWLLLIFQEWVPMRSLGSLGRALRWSVAPASPTRVLPHPGESPAY